MESQLLAKAGIAKKKINKKLFTPTFCYEKSQNRRRRSTMIRCRLAPIKIKEFIRNVK